MSVSVTPPMNELELRESELSESELALRLHLLVLLKEMFTKPKETPKQQASPPQITNLLHLLRKQKNKRIKALT